MSQTRETSHVFGTHFLRLRTLGDFCVGSAGQVDLFVPSVVLGNMLSTRKRGVLGIYRTDGVFCLDFLQISTEIPFVQ